MDLKIRSGGDDSCFLFNITSNLRFDTLKLEQIALSGGAIDIPVFTSTRLEEIEDDENSDVDIDEENDQS